MIYQQFISHAYCGAAGPVSNMASQQEKAFCLLHFEVSRFVITEQREFCERLKEGTTQEQCNQVVPTVCGNWMLV
jgi:hypothetical protein